MTCGAFEDWMLDEIDGGLSDEAQALLEAHLSTCAGCRTFRARQLELDRAMRDATSPQLAPPALSLGFCLRSCRLGRSCGSRCLLSVPLVSWRGGRRSMGGSRRRRVRRRLPNYRKRRTRRVNWHAPDGPAAPKTPIFAGSKSGKRAAAQMAL
jgi:hypothetical protein